MLTRMVCYVNGGRRELNIICTICVRKGSRGVPNKNLRKIQGKPLLAYSIDQALQSGQFAHVVISTDSEDLAEAARFYGAECWFLRPPELASSEAAKVPAIRHALLESERKFDEKYDVLVDLDATSPLREVTDINNALDVFFRENADNLITASPARKNPYFNMVEKVDGQVTKVKNINKGIVRRQDAPDVFDMNASIYIWKREVLITRDDIFGDKTSLYVMPEERSIDIDTQLDWDVVEFLINRVSDD